MDSNPSVKRSNSFVKSEGSGSTLIKILVEREEGEVGSRIQTIIFACRQFRNTEKCPPKLRTINIIFIIHNFLASLCIHKTSWIGFHSSLASASRAFLLFMFHGVYPLSTNILTKDCRSGQLLSKLCLMMIHSMKMYNVGNEHTRNRIRKIMLQN